MKKDDMFYLKTIQEVEKKLTSDKEKGISPEKAKERLNKFGENRLAEKKKISMWEIFVRQFKSIVMILLTAAAIASFFIGEVVEGVAVLVVILITAILGLIMEYKAGKSIEALKKTVQPKAKVIRNGEISNIYTKKIVIGDLILLEEGDKIPADGRLVEAENLSVDEAMLTGESDSVDKSIETLENDEKVDIADRKNMVFMGSKVIKGNGKFLVTSTGEEAEIGKISKMLQETEDEDTPLEERLEQTGRYLIVITLIITGIVALIGYLTGKPLLDMLKTAIALAIAAVPEGLPAAATITLAIGMNRMAKKKALMRNLPAVETLGSSTVFCVDKTGTLTENEMTLQKIIVSDREINVSGLGYNPEGEFSEGNEKLDPTKDKSLSLILKIGVLCSEAVLNKNSNDNWEIIGDPTEGSLIVAAKKAGYERDSLEKEYQREEEIPFDPSRKYMAIISKTSDKNKRLFMKGAPEVILDMCDRVYQDDEVTELTDNKKKKLKNKNMELAKDSFRVLAIAYKNDANDEIEKEVKNKMIFLGFVGMIDPPREGVKDSITTASKAGIRTIMLTGDQKETAISIAKK